MPSGDATQAQDAAATRIQARVRGAQSRTQQHRVANGVTKLQALQRGRFSRREYARLLEFSREQDAFLLATERRQLRIWRNEQELYFLQHTTTAQLEKIRDFQRKRGANLIQRTWRASRPATSAASDKPQNLKSQHPKDRIFAFDPFQLGSREASTATRTSSGFLKCEEKGEIGSRVEPQSLEKGLLGPLPSAPRGPPSAALDRDKFQTRRKDLQDRIKQRAQVQTQKDKLRALHSSPPSKQQGPTSTNQLEDALSPTNKQANRRRELYDQLVHLRATAAKRVHKFETQYRSTRTSRELLTAKLASSCENRLRLLQQQQGTDLSTMLPTVDKSTRTYDPSNVQAQTARFQAETQHWSPKRQARAWQSHSQIVQTIQNKRNWWQTSIAGCEKDIRKVYADSPWENERKVWTWPSRHGATDSHEERGPTHSSDIDAFLFSLHRLDSQVDDQREDAPKCPPPVDDHEASEWWRAHCIQPHLVISNSSENGQHEASHNNNDEDEFRHRLWSSEALANPTFHRLYLESQLQSRTTEHKLAVNTLTDRFQKYVNQRVGEVEMQIEVNTKLQQEVLLRRQQIKKRRTREENAVVSIQRVFRGLQGRKVAQQVRAEFFVMVRGRAIRKGKCEECGEQQAVLECNECEESLHFCPVCWVQVHATRRRRLHVAIPMSVTFVDASRRVGVAEAGMPTEGHRARAPPTISTTVATTSKKPRAQPEPVSGGVQTGAAMAARAGEPQPLKAKAATLAPTIKKEAQSSGNGTLFDDCDQSGGGGGDSSCPPPAEEDANTESNSRPAEATTTTSEEASKPVASSAKTAKSARATASKAVILSPRLSLKQRREDLVATKGEDVGGGSSGETNKCTPPVISDAAASHSVEASGARETAALDANSPAQIGGGGAELRSAPDSSVTQVLSKAKAPSHARFKQGAPSTGQETEEIETKAPGENRPSEADTSRADVKVKNEEVCKPAQQPANKARPAARMSLKQRMRSSSSSSVQNETTSSPPEVLAEPLSVHDSGGTEIESALRNDTIHDGTERAPDVPQAPATPAEAVAEPHVAAIRVEADGGAVVRSETVTRPFSSAAAAEDPKPSHSEDDELKAPAPQPPSSADGEQSLAE